MLRPNQAGEPIEIRGRVTGRDYRGRPEYAESTVVEHCIIAPAGSGSDTQVRADGFVHIDMSRLQVLAPPGTVVKDDDVVVIRGEDYRVDQLQSFDYSPGRRPAVRHHSPRVVFTVERGEGSRGVN